MTTNGPECGRVSLNNTDGFKRLDWGWQAGAGYVLDVKKGKLAIDVRYGHELTSLSRNITRYNQMVSISVSMFKHFKKNIFQQDLSMTPLCKTSRTAGMSAHLPCRLQKRLVPL